MKTTIKKDVEVTIVLEGMSETANLLQALNFAESYCIEKIHEAKETENERRMTYLADVCVTVQRLSRELGELIK